MSTPRLIYKTSSPAAISWWQAVANRNSAVMRRRRAYEEALLAQFGPVGKRYQYDAEPFDSRPVMRNEQNQVTGVLSASGERPPAGSGWRLDAASGFWKPDLRTNAGKARSAELEALAGVDVREESYAAVGVPGAHLGGHRLYRHGMLFRQDTSEIYVTWGSQDCRSSMPQAPVEGIAWVEVPLSEWHAWREQVEAEQVAGEQAA